MNLNPLDLSFDPEPNPASPTSSPCPYATIGADVTIARPVPTKPLKENEDVKETVTTTAKRHLQKFERKKLMRGGTPDSIDASKVIHGNILIGKLLSASIVLIPIAIEPHGEWGPMFENFLFNYTPRHHKPYLTTTWPNANTMCERATTYPCPIGIIHTATSLWKQTKSRTFYGHSHTAPTPKEYILQRLGLSLTKALVFHLRRAKHRTGTKPISHATTYLLLALGT